MNIVNLLIAFSLLQRDAKKLLRKFSFHMAKIGYGAPIVFTASFQIESCVLYLKELRHSTKVSSASTGSRRPLFQLMVSMYATWPEACSIR